MRIEKLAFAIVAAALVACGSKPAAPAKPAAATTSTAQAPKEGAKAEETTEAPDPHHMPGMSDLFSGKDEKKH